MGLTLNSGYTIGPGVVLDAGFNPPGSLYFDGASWLLTTQVADLMPGTGDFTVEWWQNMDPATTINARLWEIGVWSGTIWGVSEENSPSPELLYWDTQSGIYKSGGSVPVSSWAHIALVKQSNTLSFYINGAQVYTTVENRNIDNAGNIPLTLGAENGGTSNTLWKGYLTNFRINHNAVYDPTQATITVPTHPLTADSNTKLLLSAANSSNPLVDTSGLGHTFAQNGNGVTWSNNSPFVF